MSARSTKSALLLAALCIVQSYICAFALYRHPHPLLLVLVGICLGVNIGMLVTVGLARRAGLIR